MKLLNFKSENFNNKKNKFPKATQFHGHASLPFCTSFVLVGDIF